jgi:peptidyl-prolyl cis-trans isomerase B (cyclophilin B)
MRKLLRATALILCACAAWANASTQTRASAQRRTVRRPAATKKAGGAPAPSPNATPAPTPAPTPAKPVDPFENAPAEALAGRCVRLETEAGVIELETLPQSAPQTVRNFLSLVSVGALDTTTFNRVVPGFVVQGGNLSTHQRLTPELAERSRRTVPDEPNDVQHVRGIVSMARPETPNGATTNFFILVSEAKHLDGKFAAFARVRAGMEVVDAINKAPVEGEKPVSPVRVTRAAVFRCAGEKPEPPKPPRD